MSDLAQILPWGRDEAGLVTELQAGSDAAFDWLVTYYHAGVYNLVYGILSDSADAADVTQEVFLRAFRGIRGFRQGSSLKTWLYRISVRQALNHRRWCWRHHRQQVSIDADVEGRNPALDLKDLEATPLEQVETAEMQAVVRRALAQVPDVFRSAVILRDLEGLSYEEVAEVLEVSVGTVKSRILRGRRILREILDPVLHASKAAESDERNNQRGNAPEFLQRTSTTAAANGHMAPSPSKLLPRAVSNLRDQKTRRRPMNCHDVARRLPGYFDGAIPLDDHAVVREHLNECGDCRDMLESYRRLSVCLANVEPVAAPSDLAMRIRVQAAHSVSPWVGFRRSCSRALSSFQDVFKPLAVPATGGILTALVVFVLVVGNVLVGVPMGIVANDLPLNLVQPARLESLAPFPVPGVVATEGDPNSGVLVLEATLNSSGEVVSYNILSGPSDDAVKHQIDQVLLFSRFRPELSFGRPTGGGRVLLSFSEVRVHG